MQYAYIISQKAFLHSLDPQETFIASVIQWQVSYWSRRTARWLTGNYYSAKVGITHRVRNGLLSANKRASLNLFIHSSLAEARNAVQIRLRRIYIGVIHALHFH